jgi:NAD(P)-dependent dehydrogenase (short-subunit alcohol dehydrogenase family)
MGGSLDGRVAVVTGGARGIGYAVAEALGREAASVVIGALTESHLDRAAAALRERGVAVEAVRADMREPGQVEHLVSMAVDRFGGLDILVNNAGVGAFTNVADMSIEQWRQVIDTNLTGVFYACHFAIPHLRRRGGGWIVNISSLAGKNAFAGGAAYCASKAGLNQFSEALMQEVRYDNIRVSYLMPGSVATGFSGRESGAGDDWKLTAGDVAQVVMDLIAMPARSLPSRVELRPSRPRK